MTSMTRAEYLNALEKALRSIEESDRMDALEYYREYFDEAGPENEQKVIEELGPPKKLAAQIKAQCAMKAAERDPKSGKKGIKAAWLAIASIFAVPVALPLAIALAIVLLALLITLIAVLVSLLMVAVACGVTGVVSFLVSLVALVQNLPASLTMMGMGLSCAAVGVLLFVPTLIFSRWCFRRLAALLHRMTTRRNYV